MKLNLQSQDILNRVNKIMNELEGDYDRMSEYGQAQVEKYWKYSESLTALHAEYLEMDKKGIPDE